MLRCKGSAWQMSAPVLYLDNRLWLPVDFARFAADSLVPGAFQFLSDSLLLVQRTPDEPVPHVRLRQVGNRTYLTWKLSERPPARLQTDRLEFLGVDLPGIYVDPLSPPAPEPREGACLSSVEPYPGGTRFIFRVDARVRAWREQWRPDAREYRLTLSANEGDLAYRTYHPWDALRASEEAVPPGPIVLVLPDAPHPSDGPVVQEAVRYVREIGRRVAERLEKAAEEVRVYEEMGDDAWAPVVNARSGSVCLGLRADLAGEALLPGCRIVTHLGPAAQRPFVPLEALPGRHTGSTPEDLPRGGAPAPLRLWEGISIPYAAHTDALCGKLGGFLAADFPAADIRFEEWPAAFLEGLDLPAAILYLGELESAPQNRDYEGERRDDRLVNAIAATLWTFLRDVRESGKEVGEP